MSYLDRIIGVSALVLGLLTMAGMLSTDAYSTGARVDARSYKAMTHLIVNDPLCLNDDAASGQTAPNSRTIAQ